MTYQRAVAYLDALGIDAMKSLKPSLHRIEALCEALDHPERAVPAIHIAGTNGKSSVARIAASLLQAAGLSVGTYTSPHLSTVRERIARGSEVLSEEEFAAAFGHLLPYVELVEAEMGERLSYFEILTAMFYLWAADAGLDVIVVETGLGGRWDATNVVTSMVQVITNIALDHTELLGPDRVSIAAEKAGIIGPGGFVVTGERAPDAAGVINDAADEAGAGMSSFATDFTLDENSIAVGGRYLSITTGPGRSYEGLFLPVHGAHQGVNAALALEAVTRFAPSNLPDHDVVAHGFAEVSIPGRLEVVRTGTETSAPVVLDVAHNPDGVSALTSSLIEGFAFERALVVFGALDDKDHAGMIAELARMPSLLFVAPADSRRAVSAARLMTSAERVGLEATPFDDVRAATEAAIASATPADLVLITGSHYVVGEARRGLLQPGGTI